MPECKNTNAVCFYSVHNRITKKTSWGRAVPSLAKLSSCVEYWQGIASGWFGCQVTET
jgi:hypothetical protein